MFDFLWPILNVFILADWTDFNHSPSGHQTLVIGQVNLANDHLPLYLLLKRESKLPTVKPENSSMLTQRAGVQRGPRFLSACYIQNSQQFDSWPWRTANALFHRWQLQLSAVCVNKSSETHKRHSRLSRARLIRFVRFTSQQGRRGCYTWKFKIFWNTQSVTNTLGFCCKVWQFNRKLSNWTGRFETPVFNF